MRSYDELYGVCDRLATRWAADVAAQRAWHAAAAAAAARAASARAREEEEEDDDGGDDAAVCEHGDVGAALAVTPAWQVLSLCAEEAPAEAMLVALRALLGAGQRMWAMEHARTRALSGACGVPVDAPVRVSQDEFADALRDGAAVAAGGALLLAQLRVAGSLSDYASACELLAAQLAAYAAAVAAAMRDRTAWSEQLLEGGVAAQAAPLSYVGASTFFVPVLEMSCCAPSASGGAPSGSAGAPLSSSPAAASDNGARAAALVELSAGGE
jgi:hypothetical protein